MNGLDLAGLPVVKPMLRSRWPQLLVTVLALGGFVLAIVAGLSGTPVGNRNFSIVVVWIAWWALLILVAVPLLGRGWCSVCPIPAPGEWLQRGAVLGPRRARLGLGRRWPRRLRNIWLQNAAFLLVVLFAAVVLTQPLVTGLLLLSLVLLAGSMSLVFERRAFCRYMCPVGGFIGLYSQLAPLELRVKDTAICAAHRVKTCYTGNADGYGCPWQVFPAGLRKNTNCGLCMECVRTCPYDNIAINLRSFGADLHRPGERRLDEAYKAFIMLGSALVYAAVMLGPWGWLKSVAYAVGGWHWFVYAVAFLVGVLVLLPTAFYLAVRLGHALARSESEPQRSFLHLAYALVPLGLSAWIAFSLGFVFANLSYVWPAVSDPMGWGWNLVGTAGIPWTPYVSRVVPLLQVTVLLAGLTWSVRVAREIAAQVVVGRSTTRAAGLVLPLAGFMFVITILFLWLLV